MIDNSWQSNWKSQSYPSPETTSLKQWAWEFLRRNEDYQKDYATASVIPLENHGADSIDRGVPVRYIYSDPQPRDDEKVVYRMVAPHSSDIAYQDLCNKWSISAMFNPSLAYSEWLEGLLHFQVFSSPPCSTYEEYQRGHFVRPESPGQVLMVFDLSAVPISLLLSSAKKTLELLKGELEGNGQLVPDFNSRQQVKLFPKYLQILDAKAAGINPNSREVFDHVYQRNIDLKTAQSRMDRNLPAALDMTCGKWRLLANEQFAEIKRK